MPKKYQNFYLATQMERVQSSYFCRGPDDFCWGPAPVGRTLVTGPQTMEVAFYTIYVFAAQNIPSNQFTGILIYRCPKDVLYTLGHKNVPV